MGGEAGGVAEALRPWGAVLLDGTGLQRETRRLDPVWAERVAKLALYSWELNFPIWVILTSTRSQLQLQAEHLSRQLLLIYGFNSV